MDILEKVKELVKEASKLCFKDNLIVESKGSNTNYVTDVDKAVEVFLGERLPKLIDGSRMLGEEGDSIKDASGYVWVVDPIDGTANFIRHFNLSAISVGLFYNTEPTLGVIYNPFTDEMLYSKKGEGAFLNGTPIHVSDRDYNHSTIFTAFSLYDKTQAEPCFNILQRIYYDTDDMRRLGSAALELASLAAGRAELYFEIRIFFWDFAAGLSIISEAGGYYEILNFSEEPIDYNKPYALIAANSKESLEKLKAIVTEEINAWKK
ncbi:MAG: inositol monophosphatase [Lachnospiraceae bacterium]|nr:inositol monophosphatase [Lachnospiraceae bacterium]